MYIVLDQDGMRYSYFGDIVNLEIQGECEATRQCYYSGDITNHYQCYNYYYYYDLRMVTYSRIFRVQCIFVCNINLTTQFNPSKLFQFHYGLGQGMLGQDRW